MIVKIMKPKVGLITVVEANRINLQRIMDDPGELLLELASWHHATRETLRVGGGWDRDSANEYLSNQLKHYADFGYVDLTGLQEFKPEPDPFDKEDIPF